MRAVLAALLALTVLAAQAQDACKSRGELDTPYCDENGDLLADPPRDPKRQKNPETLFFTNSPLEDPAVFKKLMEPFVEHLATCVGRRIRFYDVFSSAAAIEAMRSGRMHLGTMSSGDTAFAVNVAGAIPIGILLIGHGLSLSPVGGVGRWALGVRGSRGCTWGALGVRPLGALGPGR